MCFFFLKKILFCPFQNLPLPDHPFPWTTLSPGPPAPLPEGVFYFGQFDLNQRPVSTWANSDQPKFYFGQVRFRPICLGARREGPEGWGPKGGAEPRKVPSLKGGARRVGDIRWVARRVGGCKISRYFPFPPKISPSLLSLGLLVELWSLFKTRSRTRGRQPREKNNRQHVRTGRVDHHDEEAHTPRSKKQIVLSRTCP